MLRFDPFRDLDRVTEQLLGAPSGTARAPRFMPMDLYRHGDHYVLHADLPGVDPGSVDVDVDHGTLTIRAERSAPREPDTAGGGPEVQWIASERFAGTYQRQLALGENIDPDGIAATYAHGVLTVTIPVAERARPRRIAVQSADEPRTLEGTPAG